MFMLNSSEPIKVAHLKNEPINQCYYYYYFYSLKKETGLLSHKYIGSS